MIRRKIWKITSVLFFVAAAFNNAANATNAGLEFKVMASSDRQWTGVAVSEHGRVFVNYPYWSNDVPASVAEIVDEQAIPYPSSQWNNRKNIESFNAVQSVVIDAENRLWILDTNNPQMKGVKKDGPIHLPRTEREIFISLHPRFIYRKKLRNSKQLFPLIPDWNMEENRHSIKSSLKLTKKLQVNR